MISLRLSSATSHEQISTGGPRDTLFLFIYSIYRAHRVVIFALAWLSCSQSFRLFAVSFIHSVTSILLTMKRSQPTMRSFVFPKVDICPPSLPPSAYGESRSLLKTHSPSVTMATYIPYTSERYCSPRSSEMHALQLSKTVACKCLSACVIFE